MTAHTFSVPDAAEVRAWREPVLRRLLTGAALVAPLAMLLPSALQTYYRTPLDLALLGGAGLLPVVVRLVPVGSWTARTAAVVTAVFVAGVYALGRAGFAAGGMVALMAAALLASMFLGRRAGLLFLTAGVLALLVVGWLITNGRIQLLAAGTDPLSFRNWIRMATTVSLGGLLLAFVVDSVIRHAEGAAATAAAALSRVRLAYRRLEHLHARLEAAKEDERVGLSAELHEGLAQPLSALKHRLQIEEAASGNSDTGLRETAAIVDGLMARVRKMTGDLRPPLLDKVGLVRALRAYLDEQASISGLAIAFEVTGVSEGTRFTPDVEIVCFRVVQESITNILRHAAARTTHVRMVRAGERISLSIEDDGKGFEPVAGGPEHLGILGMRERVEERGGTFALRSRPGDGTTIEISLPVSTSTAPIVSEMPLFPGPPTAEDEEELAAPGPWRTTVRGAMLNVGALVTPMLALLALLVGGSHRDTIDILVLAATGLLLPVLRVAAGLSLTVRVHLAISAMFLSGVYVLAAAGLGTGASVFILASALTAVICLRRGIGFALLGASFVAHLVIGVLVTRGLLHQAQGEVDPYRFQHWARLATLIALVGVWLTLLMDFVIVQLEANGRAAITALGALQSAYRSLGYLHGRLEATREEERRFLAHELHDELGQTLTAIKLRLQMAARSRAGGSASRPPTSSEAIVLVERLIALVRRISAELRPPLLDEAGLYPALRAFLEAQAAASGVPIELHAAPGCPMPSIGADLEIVAFRVVQEAVANALRHAGASRVVVELGSRGESVRAVVRDDGRGFDAATLEQSDAGGRLGVVSMRERIRAVDGTFRLDSGPERGTRIEIELPAARTPDGAPSAPPA